MTKAHIRDISRFISRLERLSGRHVKYRDDPIEIYLDTPCAHGTRCLSLDACLTKSDGPRNKDPILSPNLQNSHGLLPRYYYYQAWARGDHCRHCGKILSSPMSAYEKTKPEVGKHKYQGVLLLICKSCDRVISAYQPINSLRNKYQGQKRREKDNGAEYLRNI